MTTYGTIPTSHPPYTPSSNLEFISNARHKIQSTLTSRRPWNLFFSLSSLSFPSSFNDTLSRINSNLSYFRMNYAIIALLILFCSLLWHPISLIVFIIAMAAWLFLYFLRDSPLIMFGRNIDDRIVLGFLTVMTVVFLLFTDVTVNIVVALGVALLCIVVHGTVRRPDDLPLPGSFDDEGRGGGGGGYSRVVGGLGERLPLKDTASSSFSAAN
ncbi:PRA1 family protein F2 [Bienertia sinuspersici]